MWPDRPTSVTRRHLPRGVRPRRLHKIFTKKLLGPFFIAII
jgi:hypothetical protein